MKNAPNARRRIPMSKISLFEQGLKAALGVGFIIVCAKAPYGKCKEDLNGLCYHCYRDMTEDGG